MSGESSQLPEFIFGSLSTPAGRLKQVCTDKLGLKHDGILPLDPKPQEAIRIQVRVGADLAVTSVTLYYTTDGSLPTWDGDNAAVVNLPLVRTELKWDTLQWGYLETWSGEIPGQDQGTHVQYLITAITTTGELIYCPYVDWQTIKSLAEVDQLKYDIKALQQQARLPSPQIFGFYVDLESIPSWLEEAVIYQIFVDRFAPDAGQSFFTPATRNGFYGGTLEGIISKLDYLKELGVNCLWLTPIFPSPSHHGYDPIAHDQIEPRLGKETDWDTLVTQAHQKGLRIILDYVVNHISNQHPAFIAAKTDANNPTYHWFRFQQWPDVYDCFFDVPGQPEINSDYPECRSYFIAHACQWLKRGADGFRLDYAHGVTHAFWSAFRAATRSIRADSITLGEITSTPDALRSYSGRMDGCLDFKLLELLRGFFAFETLSVSQFDQALEQHFAYFNSSLVLPSFLDNHDMNRFLWIVKGDRRKLKLAALCQFTLPGPPIIYYGTEIGLSQIATVGPLEESRLPMLWRHEEQDQQLLSFYRKLITFRRDNAKIWKQRQRLLIDNPQKIYGYVCGDYAVILNNSSKVIDLKFLNWTNAHLILSSDSANCWDDQRLTLQLQAFSGVIAIGK
ncbi:alpha-amylase family glycosyl hydrolase [Gloeothece verrucosa]|uniref:Alpha amylase catalytic region n=1 Tax=Gloeothece verrucosa (strain PCC 7822) TaxID=497965 RepID=E0UH75_GLOV7|nr:alpha-amylase family glycosyl hydrolase [Gloeothece verrucosa]ADN16789.1 alpha amylase catalytic region [Gloeothece verrucosa PCC 7822]